MIESFGGRCLGCGGDGVSAATGCGIVLPSVPLCPPGVSSTAKENTVEAPLGHPTQARSKAARQATGKEDQGVRRE